MSKNIKILNLFLIMTFLFLSQKTCFAPKEVGGQEGVDGQAQFTPLVGGWHPRVIDDTGRPEIQEFFDKQNVRLKELQDSLDAMRGLPKTRASLIGQGQLPPNAVSDMAALAKSQEVSPRLSMHAPRAKEFGEQRALALPIPSKQDWPFGDEPPSPGAKTPLARKSKKVADHSEYKSREEIDDLWRKQFSDLVEFGFANQKDLIKNAEDPTPEDISKPMKNNFDTVDSGISDSDSSLTSKRELVASWANDFSTFKKVEPGEFELKTVDWYKPTSPPLPIVKGVEGVGAGKVMKYQVDPYGQFSPVPKKDKSRKR